jgi:signal transduction histidine kinase
LGQLLRQDLDGERAQKRLDVLLAEVERVDDLARGYLSLSRPLHDLRLEKVDLVQLVEGLVALLEARARAANVRLELRGERSLPLEADPRRVREALLNLAENALRAMPDGGTLAFVIEARPSGARILVEDEGVGASDEALAALGKAFEPGGDGTGLGVAIARGAIGQHGGTLAVERRVPRGLRAIVSWPRTPGAA